MKGFSLYRSIELFIQNTHIEIINMNKYIYILIGIALLLLLYFIGDSYLSIAAPIALGLIFGVLQKLFVGYIHPSNRLFRLRFIIYGIGFGFMIGLLLFLTISIINQSFEIIVFTRCMLISIPLGSIYNGSILSFKFRELKQKTNGDVDHQDTPSDFAIYRDTENNINRGRLLLLDGKLSFYSSELDGCLFEFAIKDLHPEIHQSKFMGIPNGFNLPNRPGWVNIAFPHYWVKIIEAERLKMILQTTNQ